jgi:hypothetical protein
MIIPINPYANQDLTVMLGGQKCQITIKQKSTGVFIDVTVNNVLMIQGQICIDRVPVLFNDYRGFIGAMQFEDTQGKADPVYTSFGSRWQLAYYA